MYDVFIGASKVDLNMKGILYKNRKLMSDYQGLDGWKKFIEMMLLDDYTNDNKEPKQIFKQVWLAMKGLTREEYFEAFEQYCSFCEQYIPKRSERIADILKQILHR